MKDGKINNNYRHAKAERTHMYIYNNDNRVNGIKEHLTRWEKGK